MTTEDAVSLVSEFEKLDHPGKIKFFGWHLHVHKNRTTFTARDIESCYDDIHSTKPGNIYRDLARLAEKKPAALLGDSKGYRLERSVREAFDVKYGSKQTTLRLAAELEQLPSKVSNLEEKVFLDETISCLRVGAYRAAVTMAWNLAFYHLLSFIVVDATRLSAFNDAYEKVYKKLFERNGAIQKYEDFGDKLKESEALSIAKSAGLISRDVFKILEEKLGKRNSAAHPSAVKIERLQAESFIDDLVKNVVLKLI